MQVFGNIGSAPEKKVSKNGKEYFRFRLAENQGRDENRTTQWYEVNAFISEMDGDFLAKSMFVKVTGRLVVEAFMKKDGTPGASATIMAFDVEPVERKARPKDET
jgi:single-stranded DNA-binding protein